MSYGCGCDPNKGDHGDACPVIRELRETATEEGRAAYMARYREQLRRRAEERDRGAGYDVPHKLQRMGVPTDCLLALRGPADTAALEAARRFVQAPRSLARTLLLVGHKGVGKSVAAAHVLWKWAAAYDWGGQPSGGNQRSPAAWVRASALTSATDFGRVDPEWLESLRGAQMLVLDDLGDEATAAGVAALRDLLAIRYERQRQTVLTSNLVGGAFAARYGAALLERLQTSGMVPDLSREKSLRQRRDR